MKDAPLSFYQASRMGWDYARNDDTTDEIMVGDYGDHDLGVGACGEFGIRWHRLGSTSPTARLEVFEDAWAALATSHGQKLVAWLAANHRKNPSPETVCAFLSSIGCKDNSRKPAPLPTPAPREVSDEDVVSGLTALLRGPAARSDSHNAKGG